MLCYHGVNDQLRLPLPENNRPNLKLLTSLINGQLLRQKIHKFRNENCFLSVFEIFRSFYTTQQPLLCLPSIASANHYVHPNLSGPNTQITSNKGNHGSILQTIGVFEHVMYWVALTRAWQCYHRTRLQSAWCWSAKWNWKKFRGFVEIVRTNQRMLQVDSCRGWPGSMIQIGYRTVNLALNQSSWVLTSQVGSRPVKFVRPHLHRPLFICDLNRFQFAIEAPIQMANKAF